MSEPLHKKDVPTGFTGWYDVKINHKTDGEGIYYARIQCERWPNVHASVKLNAVVKEEKQIGRIVVNVSAPLFDIMDTNNDEDIAGYLAACIACVGWTRSQFSELSAIYDIGVVKDEEINASLR